MLSGKKGAANRWKKQEVNSSANSSANSIKVKYSKERIHAIVGFLNSTCGTAFRDSGVATQRHISARIAEGYTDDDFKAVILYKHKEWSSDPKMRAYLRPETLFGTKFEGYLQLCRTKETKPLSKDVLENIENNKKYDKMMHEWRGA
jgi:uncharacterized phage protein (TIGR02220 family)